MKSLFTEIDSCSHTAVSSVQVTNLFIYFYCQCSYFFPIHRLELSFRSRFCFCFRDYVSGFRIPDSGFPILSFKTKKQGWFDSREYISLLSWRYCVVSRVTFGGGAIVLLFLDRGSAAKTLISQYRQLRRLGIYYILTDISEGTAFLLQGLTYTETLQFENKK